MHDIRQGPRLTANRAKGWRTGFAYTPEPQVYTPPMRVFVAAVIVGVLWVFGGALVRYVWQHAGGQ